MPSYRAKKRFGQNFLNSTEVITKIIETISPQAGDCIIEIGPGQGALTAPLVNSGATLTAVEFDRDLVGSLREKFAQYEQVEIIEADFLKYNPVPNAYKLVGNLPYNITTPVLEKTVTNRDAVIGAYYMMQKEVAERLAGSPGSKNWSPLALFTQLHYKITIEFLIAPKYFTPPPKVTSAFVSLLPKPSIKLEYPAQFEKLVRSAFTQRRKTLLNNLCPALVEDSKQLVELLADMSLDSRIRAEQVSTEQFLSLTSRLVSAKLL